jgi:hypothetical protein
VPAGLAVGGGEVLEHGAGYWEEMRDTPEIIIFSVYSFSFLLTTLSYLYCVISIYYNILYYITFLIMRKNIVNNLYLCIHW